MTSYSKSGEPPSRSPVSASLLRSGGRPVVAGSGTVSVGARPVTSPASASSTTKSPRPPASTTPARASSGSWAVVWRTARSAASAAAGAAAVSSLPAAAAAASSSTVRIVPGRGRDSAERRRDRRRRASARAEIPLLGDDVGHPAQHLRQQHPGVAAGADQRTLGQRRGEIGRTVRLGERGTHREQHVRAGVAVGDGEDVDPVDLRAVPLQTVGRRAHPPGEQHGVESGSLYPPRLRPLPHAAEGNRYVG